MGPDPAQEQCHPAGANPLRLPWAQQSQPILASWWRKPVVKALMYMCMLYVITHTLKSETLTQSTICKSSRAGHLPTTCLVNLCHGQKYARHPPCAPAPSWVSATTCGMLAQQIPSSGCDSPRHQPAVRQRLSQRLGMRRL
jgi:hypothetical protein